LTDPLADGPKGDPHSLCHSGIGVAFFFQAHHSTLRYTGRLCRWHGFLPFLLSAFLKKEYRFSSSIVKVQGA